MQTSRGHPSLRPRRLNSYTAYGVGCTIAWGILWAIVLAVDPTPTIDKVGWVFGGWVIGWVSASIARLHYPPPKRRHRAGRSTFLRGASKRGEGRSE